MSGGVERCVFFQCNDCGKAFWKKPLAPPRERFIQHNCSTHGKTTTRVFGQKAKKCPNNHPGGCVEKCSEEDYYALPNCGKHASYLKDPEGWARRRQPRAAGSSRGKPRRSKPKKPRKRSRDEPRRDDEPALQGQSEAVRNILRQNELLHRASRKQGSHGKPRRRPSTKKRRRKNKKSSGKASIWDPAADVEESFTSPLMLGSAPLTDANQLLGGYDEDEESDDLLREVDRTRPSAPSSHHDDEFTHHRLATESEEEAKNRPRDVRKRPRDIRRQRLSDIPVGAIRKLAPPTAKESMWAKAAKASQARLSDEDEEDDSSIENGFESDKGTLDAGNSQNAPASEDEDNASQHGHTPSNEQVDDILAEIDQML